MKTNSKAAVFHAVGQPHELRDARLPSLNDGEVLVRVRLCTLCGSDLHTYGGKRASPTPTILGHEIIGDVEAVGGGAKADLRNQSLSVGDRVTWSIAAHCGRCFACEHEMPQKCERLFKYGHERLSDARPLSGGLAEHCVLTADTPILKLPEGLSDAAACIANCATATMAGAFRIAGDCHSQSVLILGAGMLGLNAAAMANEQGASDVMVADVAADRLAVAQKFGAAAGLPFTDDGASLISAVQQRTGGRGADVVLDVSGAPAAMEAGLRAVRVGGRVVFVGAVAPTRPLAIDAEQIVRRLLTIRGLHNYVPEDLVAAVDFLSSTDAPFAQLVSTPFPLDQVEAAFAAAVEGKSLRVAVRP